MTLECFILPDRKIELHVKSERNYARIAITGARNVVRDQTGHIGIIIVLNMRCALVKVQSK